MANKKYIRITIQIKGMDGNCPIIQLDNVDIMLLLRNLIVIK